MRQLGDAEGEAVIRAEAHPFPRAARENDILRHLRVAVQHVVIDGFLLGIIIPVHQGNVLGDRLRDAGIHLAVLGVVFAARRQTEEHIAPHHRMQAVLVGQLMHTAEMIQHNLHSVAVAVLIQIFSQTDQMRLVHADVDPAASHARGELTEHRVDQLIRLFLSGQQDVVKVMHVAEHAPAEDLAQVRQRLDRGNQLDTEGIREIVHPAQILRRITAASPAEVWILRKLVNVLNVKLKHRVAHARQIHNQLAEAVPVEHRAAGAVGHQTQIAVSRRFLHREILSRSQALLEQRQRASKIRLAPQTQLHISIFTRNRDTVPFMGNRYLFPIKGKLSLLIKPGEHFFFPLGQAFHFYSSLTQISVVQTAPTVPQDAAKINLF